MCFVPPINPQHTLFTEKSAAHALLCCRLGLSPTVFHQYKSQSVCKGYANNARLKCAACGKSAAPDASQMRLCLGCGCVAFCNMDCLKSGWRDGHKTACPVLAEVRKRILNVMYTLESGTPDVLPSAYFTFMLPCLAASEGYTLLVEHAMTKSLCHEIGVSLLSVLMSDEPYEVQVRGPRITTELPVGVINVLNIRRVYSPTLMFMDTADHLDDMGHYRKFRRSPNTWTLKPERAEPYKAAMRWLLSTVGASVSADGKEEDSVDIQLRLKRARGYTHVIVGMRSLEAFALEQSVLVTRLKRYMPDLHNQLKTILLDGQEPPVFQ